MQPSRTKQWLNNKQGQLLLLKYIDCLICVWHTNSIYLSKFQVLTVGSIEVIRQDVLSRARVGVVCDLKKLDEASYPILRYTAVL